MFVKIFQTTVLFVYVTVNVKRFCNSRQKFTGNNRNRLLLAISKQLSTSNRLYRGDIHTCTFLVELQLSVFCFHNSSQSNKLYLKEDNKELILRALVL